MENPAETSGFLFVCVRFIENALLQGPVVSIQSQAASRIPTEREGSDFV